MNYLQQVKPAEVMGLLDFSFIAIDALKVYAYEKSFRVK